LLPAHMLCVHGSGRGLACLGTVGICDMGFKCYIYFNPVSLITPKERDEVYACVVLFVFWFLLYAFCLQCLQCKLVRYYTAQQSGNPGNRL